VTQFPCVYEQVKVHHPLADLDRLRAIAADLGRELRRRMGEAGVAAGSDAVSGRWCAGRWERCWARGQGCAVLD
jgi:hypothetical protein